MSRKRGVYVLGACRTPFGKFFGLFKDVPAPCLAAAAIKGLYKSLNLPPAFSSIGGLVLGQVYFAGVGQAPVKQAALLAGLSKTVNSVSVNKVCASSLYALQAASREIQIGEAGLMLAGGMENMSRAPYLLERRDKKVGPEWSVMSRQLLKGDEPLMYDSMIFDGLLDTTTSKWRTMGELADMCAEVHAISREAQEAYARASFERVLSTREAGAFDRQICDKGTKDECVRHLDSEKIKGLKPAFSQNGTVTAATSSQIADGAAVLLLGDSRTARKMRILPKARLVDFVSFNQDPIWYTTSPVGAIRDLLGRNRLTVKDIDFFEINEAFAVVPIYAMRDLGIPFEKVNVWGGAISLGHPLGASGARLVMNVDQQLREIGGRYGIACACHGRGGAMAILIKNTSA